MAEQPIPSTDLDCYRDETPAWSFPITRGGVAVDLDAAGVSLAWYLCASLADEDADALETKTLGSGLTIPTPDSGIVQAALDADDTAADGLPSAMYHRLVLTESTRKTIVARGRLFILEA